MTHTDVTGLTISIPVILEFLAHVARIGTGVFLLSLAFYLHVIAPETPDEDCDTDRNGHIVPVQFRWPPFVLGVIILDRARDSTILPFNDLLIIIVIYASFCYLMYHGFWILIEACGAPHPKKGIVCYGRAIKEDYQQLKSYCQREGDDDGS